MPHDYFTSLHGQLLHVPLVPSQIPFLPGTVTFMIWSAPSRNTSLE